MPSPTDLSLPRLKLAIPASRTRSAEPPASPESNSRPGSPPLAPPAPVSPALSHRVLLEHLERVGVTPGNREAIANLVGQFGPAWKRDATQSGQPKWFRARDVGSVLVTRQGKIAVSTGQRLGAGATSDVLRSAVVDLQPDGRPRVERAALLITRAKSREELRHELDIRSQLGPTPERVVPVLDAEIFEEPELGGYTRVMLEPEYLPSLQQRIIDGPPLSPRQRDRVTLDIMQGVAALHARKIIHNDLKADNVLPREIDGELRVDIGDLGFAARGDSPRSCELSAEYSAPELAWALLTSREDPERTPAQDAFAMGVTLYLLHHGIPPPFFRQGDSLADHMFARSALTDDDLARQYSMPAPEVFDSRAAVIRGLLACDPSVRLSVGEADRLYRAVMARSPAHE